MLLVPKVCTGVFLHLPEKGDFEVQVVELPTMGLDLVVLEAYTVDLFLQVSECLEQRFELLMQRAYMDVFGHLTLVVQAKSPGLQVVEVLTMVLDLPAFQRRTRFSEVLIFVLHMDDFGY